MKSKLLIYLLLLSVFLLTGCKNDTDGEKTTIEEHVHSFDDKLIYDNEFHWYPSSCGHEDSVEKVKHEMDYEIIDNVKVCKCLLCEYSYEETQVSLTINYQYSNGEVIGTINESLFINEEYSYKSPTIDYMKPSLEVVQGKIFDDTTIDVIYDYSYEYINDLTDIKPIYLINDKGVSISFVVSGVLDSNEVLLYGDTFEIGAGFITLRNSLEANLYHAVWDASSSFASPNGNKFGVFSQLDDERLVTLNFSVNKDIEVYVNGVLQYVYFANVMSDQLTATYNNYDYKIVEELVDAVLSEVSSKGFEIGVSKANIRNVMVGKPFDKNDALNLYNEFVQVTIKYHNEAGHNIAVPTRKFGRVGESYSIECKTIDGFVVDEYEIENHFSTNEEYLIVYETKGKERLPNGLNEINKPNSLDWGVMNQWYYFARQLMRDYTVVVSYSLWANQIDNNGYYDSWKTALLIHFDERNLDRWVSRFDSMGWQDDVNKDGNKLGSNSNYGNMYSVNSQKEMQELCKASNVVVIFTRRGSTLNMTSIITPIDGDNNEVYYSNCSLENVTRESIGLAISCEYASVKVTSIRY